MGLDVVLFRNDQGGNVEQVKESQRRRFKPVEDVDAVVAADDKHKKLRHELDLLNGARKTIINELATKLKNKEEEAAAELKRKKAEVEEKIESLKKSVEAAEVEVTKILYRIGNIVHDSVPISKTEDKNELVRTWGEMKPGKLHHHELLYMVDGFDLPRGVGVAGHRGYFLKGVGVQLNLALITYGLDFLRKRGYTALQSPFFMNKESMSKTAQLETFDEDLYKVVGDDDEKYLIATSEQPISAFHQDEWLEPKDLPLKYAGFSTCFRKEAGAHGKDTWGIFRVHQFEKVEQFCITSPEKSWEFHEEMLKTAEEFYQSLGIPYRVVNIVSGELNNAAAKKYDLEGWFPGFQEFRELVSCSNCTDYQSRSLEIRFGAKKQGAREKKYVHMLNATLCATTRTICAIMENYQTPEGVVVPEVLRSYLGGQEIFKFVHKEFPAPKGGKVATNNNNNNNKDA